jgi:YegS/Rv2252/BmrU family lipid kinase
VPPKVLFLINGNAGAMADDSSRQSLTRAIAAAFAGAEVVFTDEGSKVTEMAREAVERGSTMVVAGGGDGTINAVASALVGTETTLGVLPLGTLNHFAKDLGIPLEIEPALQALSAGHRISVDVGQINDRIFLNNSGLGLYPDTVRLREAKQRSGVGKWPAALWAALRALSRYRRLTLRVTVDGKQLLRTTPIVFVGNNEYELAGIRVPSRSQLNDGRLCLYIPHPEGRLQLLWFSVRALLGEPQQGADFDALLTEDFTISSRHRHLRISIDGEVCDMATPLHYRIRPRSLRVMAPEPTP